MLNDDRNYPNPQEFQPERYLTADGQLKTKDDIRDPTDIAFGFGRRWIASLHSSWLMYLFKLEFAQGLMLRCPSLGW